MKRMIPLLCLLLLACGLRAEEIPATRLSDADFFNTLDLSRPELADVQKAVATSDWPAAKHALAEHFRNRPTPRWGFDPKAIGKDPKATFQEADLALKHQFNSLGIVWQFGSNIDWKFNPTTPLDSKWPRNHEWTWQFNRHVPWVTLARAFYLTGDEKYAREFVAELKSWVAACPVPLTEMQNSPFSAWRTIEAGIRAGATWPQIFPHFLASKSFDDDALLLMVKSYVEHAQYLLKFHTGGNWLTMEENGLYTVGALFPEFKDATNWRTTAAHILDEELSIQVYPDGAQNELTPGYHSLALGNFLGPIRLTDETDFTPPPDYLPKVEGMFNYLLMSMEPTGVTPPLNDSGSALVGSLMKEAAHLFPERTDFRWAVRRDGHGHPPTITSCEFPYAGQFYLRSGWTHDALWLCMDGGPFGARHQHEDKLSVILTAFGQPLLVEGGTYTYDASVWRSYVLSSRAHNVVLVDGLEQDRRRSPKDTYVVTKPLPHVWESNEQFDHAAARYDEGYGPKNIHPIRQTRHVFFIKPDFYVIADELEPLDGKPHQCEALFHLDAPDASKSKLTVATRNDGPNLSITAYGADSVKIVKGEKKPVVQGWIPDPAGGYGAVKPIPTAIFPKTITTNSTVFYVLNPTRGKKATAPTTAVTWKDNSLTVTLKDGTKREIHFQPFPKS